MDRGALIRSFQAADLGFILHSRRRYPLAHRLCPASTHGRSALRRGYFENHGTTQHHSPALRQPSATGNWRWKSALKSFHTAGFLGTEYGPFLIADPADAVSAVKPPAE